MEENQSFEYTYSAPEQDEVRRIREKYMPKEENKLEQLRRLDAGVKQKATMLSIIIGVIGSLVMGTGMSMCMVWGGSLFVPGIFVGVVGMIGVGLAFPVYNRVVEKEKERIAPEILRLTDELMGEK